ncbi:hypothetical protein M378DRAFT_69093, partial [Amanita muscaria Koide BX008]
LAGISAAIALKTRLKYDNFVIYEKANDVGGTWRDNTYPGCGSDVPVHWYSLSTDLNPDWSTYLAYQPEILDYWVNLWHKYKLEPHTKLGHLVQRAEWDAELQRYRLEIRIVATGETLKTEAEIIFHALGGFLHPFFPEDVRGIDTFGGHVWHSARWNHDVDLKGKRVGVIGNGCSACQLIPQIAQEASTTVVNFARTPQWYSPPEDMTYPGWVKWAFKRVPSIMRLYRYFLMAKSEFVYLIFRKQNRFMLWIMKKLLTAYIKETAPKEYLDHLIPEFPVGCKRIIVDHGYLKSLHQPNVTLRWDEIDSVVEEGIKLKTDEVVPLDVIIFGTGYSFKTAELTVRGSKGITYLEFMDQHGGAAAYLGTCVPGFPNLFHLLGPNVATGHASVVYSEEVQINYALEIIKEIVAGRAKSFEVSEEGCEEYDSWIQRRLEGSVWTECSSYYQIGKQKGTKNVAMFPGPAVLFWWKLRKPEWNKYKKLA